MHCWKQTSNRLSAADASEKSAHEGGIGNELRGSSMSLMEGSVKDMSVAGIGGVGGPTRLPPAMDESTLLELVTTFLRRRVVPCAKSGALLPSRTPPRA